MSAIHDDGVSGYGVVCSDINAKGILEPAIQFDMENSSKNRKYVLSNCTRMIFWIIAFRIGAVNFESSIKNLLPLRRSFKLRGAIGPQHVWRSADDTVPFCQ